MENISRRNFVAGAGVALAAGTLGGAAVLAQADEAASSAQDSSAQADAASATFTPGTYTASAYGRNGEVVVNTTFSEDAIVSVLTKHEETAVIGGDAIDELASEVVESQAVDPDIISGATMSSVAFLSALRDCVQQAGGDPSALTGAADAKEPVDYVTDADVIVIGAGAAGLSAAMTAAETGAEVIILEKSGIPGGNSVMTMNGINAVDSSVQLNDVSYVNQAPEGGFKDLTLQMNESALSDYPDNQTTDEAMVDAYVANSGELIDWLVDKGMSFTVSFSEDERNNATNYWLLMGGAAFETAPKVLETLDEERKTLDNVHLYVNTQVTSITTDADGAVTGVSATTPDGDKDFTASSVIICTGGFNDDIDKVAEQRPELANAVIGVRAPTTGDGLDMAQDLGAATTNLNVMNTFPNFMAGWGMVMGGALPGGMANIDCIYVNQDAKRFTAEGFMVADALLQNEKSYAIFDASGLSTDLLKALDAGIVRQASTAEELAEWFDLDGDTLAATIDAFNEDIADGTDDEFGRENASTDPLQPPFYAYQFGVGTHYDLGGLVTNEKAQVLTEDGTPIANLYAAGEVVGSFQGTFRVDGSGIGESLVFGRIAGKQATGTAE